MPRVVKDQLGNKNDGPYRQKRDEPIAEGGQLRISHALDVKQRVGMTLRSKSSTRSRCISQMTDAFVANW